MLWASLSLLMVHADAMQELQNSILDLKRLLQEAADDRATMQTVHQQLRAEAAAKREEAEQKGRELASTCTVLKA